MRIAITGTRGIPNQYGGFEQFAEYLSVGLVESGHEVWVYNPDYHSYLKEEYRGVNIVRKKFFKKILGSAGNYLYDLSCLKDAIRRKADIILECGYASAAPWYPCLRNNDVKLVTHMDGMEREREKWGMIPRKLFLLAEKKAVRYSDALVCDHPEIAKYYQKNYSIETEMITYGAAVGENWDPGMLDNYQLKPEGYFLLVARQEPENKIRMIIEGFLASDVPEALIIIGKYDGRHGRAIFREFGKEKRLRFLGGLYDPVRLNNLRHFSKAVIHGHSVGGTNPSLLEAMAAGATIFAHDNVYNRWVLGDNAGYFSSAMEIKELVSNAFGPGNLNAAGMANQTDIASEVSITNNLKRIREDFQWDDVVRQYEALFLA